MIPAPVAVGDDLCVLRADAPLDRRESSPFAVVLGLGLLKGLTFQAKIGLGGLPMRGGAAPTVN